jgi:hypothetical protein
MARGEKGEACDMIHSTVEFADDFASSRRKFFPLFASRQPTENMRKNNFQKIYRLAREFSPQN